MIKRTNLFFLLVLSILFTFISCEKEPGCMDPAAFNYNPEAKKDDGSCIPVVLGCVDALAMNYNLLANTSDGSCLFAYNVAQGTWNINPDCEDYTIPVIGTTVSLNDQLPESIYVQQGDGIDGLFIDIDGTQISGTIDYDGNVLVPSQTISIDMGFGPMDIDVSGSGFISSENSGNMNLTYSFDIDLLPNFPISESLDCSITLTR